MIVDPQNGQSNTTELKIITTRVYNGAKAQSGDADDVVFNKGSLIFPCGRQTALEVGIVINLVYFLQPSQ